ncbi:NAD(P)-dependent oxidoreductase [Mycobacterium sp.]|uniref:NAD(P)-dependent oxidoreductase n=1 Tax=Mycobacterium sp. TaxID=1785 RepID=UPI003C769471
MKVGFIGAGRMGRPMVARLVEAGHDVRALGRTAEKRRDLEQLGAGTVSEAVEAGAQADVVVLCVFSDEQARQVCLDSALLTTMPPGSALVVHTTASPKTIEAIAARAGDVDVVDAAVSGGPHDIAAGRLTLFVGGTAEAVARLQPVLGCYSDPVLHVGPCGAGQKVKLVNNALFAGHIGLLVESIRLAERLGVPESTLLAALAHGSATSRVLSLVAAGGSVASFIEVAGEFVGKDVAVVRSIAEELGSDLGVLDDVIKTIDVAGKV